MADTYRRHGLIDAPVEDVWSIVSNPHTHPDWWPELIEVSEVGEGGEYTRTARRYGFLDRVDAVWVVEPMEHLKEVNFRCTVSGTYARFALTPAQDNTFVEVEAGVIPIGIQGRIMKMTSPLIMKRWLGSLLEALPQVVKRTTKSPS